MYKGLNIASFVRDVKENGYASQTVTMSLADRVALAKDVTPSHNITKGCISSNMGKNTWTQSQNGYRSIQEVSPRTVTLESVKHDIRRWSPQKPVNSKKSFIELDLNKGFSEILVKGLGEKNTQNVHGISDEVKELIFISFLEREAARQYDSNEALRSILSVTVSGRYVSCNVSNNIIILNDGYREYVGSILYLQTQLTIPYMDAVATLADRLGVDIQNLFSVSSVHERAAEKKNGRCHNKNIVEHCFIPQLGHMDLVDTVMIKGHSDQNIGAMLFYSLGDVDTVIPACVARNELTMGLHKSPAFLLNQNQLDTQRSPQVLVCQDIRTAITLDKTAKESKSVTSDNIIVTGHIGNDLSSVNWNYLHRKDVILIIAPNKECFSQVSEYKKYFEEANVKSFKVYPYPLLYAKPLQTLNDEEVEQLSLVETELYEKSLVIDDVERPSVLINQIIHQSMDNDSFLTWGKELQLFKGKNQEPDIKKAASVFMNLDTEPSTAFPQTYSEVFLDVHIVLEDGTTTLQSKRNTGKTAVLSGILKSFAYGTPFCGIPVSKTYKTLVLDTETPSDNILSRFQQLELNKISGDKLFVISKLDSKAENGLENFDITNENYQQKFTKLIAEHGIDRLVVDNISSGVKPGTAYSQSTPGRIFEWTQTLGRQGVGVMLLHHLNDDKKKSSIDSKMRGNQEYSIRSHTEILLIGKNEICADDKYPSFIVDEANKEGIVVGMYFKVCKKAPIIENTILWVRKDIDKSAWEGLAHTDINFKHIVNGFVPVTPLYYNENQHNDNDKHLQEVVSVENNDNTYVRDTVLSDGENKVCEAIYTKGSIKREEVECLLGSEKSTALKILNSLKFKGKIYTEGNGKATVYKLK